MVLKIYTAPVQRHPVRIWPQKSQKYRWGFVARFFWLGFVFRIGRREVLEDFRDLDQ